MGNLKKGNPQEPVALAGEVQGGSDGPEALPTRITRYSAALVRTKETIAHIVSGIKPEDFPRETLAILLSAADKLGSCGNWLHFRQYYTVGKVRLHAANFCKQHLLCNLCAIRRGAKSLGAYVKRYQALKREYPELKNSMVTFTIKNGPDMLERFNHIQAGIRELNRRRTKAKTGRHLTEWTKVLGWVGSYEIKRGANSEEWHIHAHVIVLHTEWIDAQALKAEWQRITGDSKVLRIDAAKHPNNPELDFLEVFKYAVKFGEISLDDRLEAFLKLTDRRLLFSGGLFRGVTVPADLLDEPLDGLPFIDLFYVHAEETGYSLEAVRTHQGPTTYTNPGTPSAKLAYYMIRDGDAKAAATRNARYVQQQEARAVVDLAGHVATGIKPESWPAAKWAAYLGDLKRPPLRNGPSRFPSAKDIAESHKEVQEALSRGDLSSPQPVFTWNGNQKQREFNNAGMALNDD
jgi:hypothetical protein